MIFLIVLLVLFYFYIDCDFLTFIYHFYRTRVSSNKKDGYFGKTIWIVGASSGIGEHLTYCAVRNLAQRIIISGRRVNELERVKKECNKIDNNCEIVIKQLDLLEFGKDKQICLNYIENEILGDSNVNINDIDILVINSGITQRGLGLETKLSVMNRLVNVNVIGVISLIQAYTQVFGKTKSNKKRRKRQAATPAGPAKGRGGAGIAAGGIQGAVGAAQAVGGKIQGQLANIGSLLQSGSNNKHSIFVTSSVGGKLGGPGQAAYCMSKHAINGYLEGIRVELGYYGIHVGIVCPGPIELTESSLGGIGTDLSHESGRKDKSKEGKRGKKMKVSRCAELYTTSIIYNLSESWISNNPQLLFVYLKQYLPAVYPVLLRLIGPIYMKKLLGGGNKNKNKQENEKGKGKVEDNDDKKE